MRYVSSPLRVLGQRGRLQFQMKPWKKRHDMNRCSKAHSHYSHVPSTHRCSSGGTTGTCPSRRGPIQMPAAGMQLSPRRSWQARCFRVWRCSGQCSPSRPLRLPATMSGPSQGLGSSSQRSHLNGCAQELTSNCQRVEFYGLVAGGLRECFIPCLGR